MRQLCHVHKQQAQVRMHLTNGHIPITHISSGTETVAAAVAAIAVLLREKVHLTAVMEDINGV